MGRKAAMTETYAPPVEFSYYAWWFPGSPIRVHLSLDVIRRLREQLQLAGPKIEREGLLFGKVTDGATEILDFQPASGRVPEAVASLARDGGQPLLVGYYRTEVGDSLCLTDQDLELAQACFPKPFQVFLVVQPTGFGPPTASFFFHEKDGRMAGLSLLEFPFDPTLLASEERDRIRRAQAQEATAVESSVPAPAPAEPAPKRPARRGWLVAGLLFSGLLIGAGLSSSQGALQALWSSVSSGQVQDKSLNPSARATAPTLASLSMGLRAKRENADVEISWNRESTAIAAATSGVLSVQDGAIKREIALNGTQIRNSSIVYSPVSDQLSIQLSVTTPVNTLIESVMLLMPAKSTVLPAATAPGPAREQPQPWKPPVPRPARPFTPPPTAHASVKTEMLPAAPATQPASIHKANLDALPTMIVQPVLPPAATTPVSPVDTTAAAPPAASQPPVYHPAEPVRRVVPRLPAELLTMMVKPKTIEVRVTVDKNGQVTSAAGIPQSGVNSLTLGKLITAARAWTFLPARKGDEAIPSEYVLQFHFPQ